MGTTPGEIQIGGQRYRVQAAPRTQEFADAVAAVRAPNTKDRHRMAASMVVLEGILSAEEFIALLDRLDDTEDPLDTQTLLTAAIELAQRAHT
ncbi:hypothetical protein [Nonomuraea sp. NPDC046570]|uniref:hypothetical protein n=1 Tax=Nonomuraea sp. NPDC046570 TaxID=3155255 RepID=UPI0033C2656E